MRRLFFPPPTHEENIFTAALWGPDLVARADPRAIDAAINLAYWSPGRRNGARQTNFSSNEPRQLVFPGLHCRVRNEREIILAGLCGEGTRRMRCVLYTRGSRDFFRRRRQIYHAAIGVSALDSLSFYFLTAFGLLHT